MKYSITDLHNMVQNSSDKLLLKQYEGSRQFLLLNLKRGTDADILLFNIVRDELKKRDLL